jgi:hypothetical protein
MIRHGAALLVGLFLFAFLAVQTYAGWATAGAGQASPQQDETATPTPSPTMTPMREWDLYMSDRPLGPRMTDFPGGTRTVFSNFFVSITTEPSVQVQIRIQNTSGYSVYLGSTLTFTQPQWVSLEWSRPPGEVIPASGSPYVTSLIRPDVLPNKPFGRQVEWVVGSEVYFERPAYHGTEDQAMILARDINAYQQQETVQVHVKSGTDPTGFDVILKQRVTFGLFSTEPGEHLRFCLDTECSTSDATNARLRVSNPDVITATYTSLGGLFLTDTATWDNNVPFTPTVPPTVGPSPTPTLTPSPTMPPQAIWVEISPEPGKVGYLKERDGLSENRLGSSSIIAGMNDTGGAREEYVGALQFDLVQLTSRATIHQAYLELYGKEQFYTYADQEWDFQLLDPAIDSAWGPTLAYTQVRGTTVLATLSPAIHNTDFRASKVNRFDFKAEQIAVLAGRLETPGQRVSLRIDGPALGSTHSTGWMSWYNEDTGSTAWDDRPKLHVLYSLRPPTDTPTATASPTASVTSSATPSATPTLTPTPTASHTPSVTASPIATATSTPSSTASASATPTFTGTPLPSPTPSNTPTASRTPSATPTPTASASATASPTPSVTATPSTTATATATTLPGLLIYGGVQNCQGAMLAGARVELEGTGHAAQTDAAGLYVLGPIDNFLAGDYKLTASVAGHLSRSQTLSLPEAGVRQVNFAGIYCLVQLALTATSTATATPTSTVTVGPTDSPTPTATGRATPTPTTTRLVPRAYLPVVVRGPGAGGSRLEVGD